MEQAWRKPKIDVSELGKMYIYIKITSTVIHASVHACFRELTGDSME